MKLNEITETQPEMVMLVGLPGSGKSTYIAQLKKHKNYVVISTDDILEQIAKDSGISYSDAFNSYYKESEKKMFIHLRQAINKKQNIIIDQTNMTVGSRSRKLGLVPNSYTKIAVVFSVDSAELQRRLDNREKETGKRIPSSVIKSMREAYQEPTKSEGFAEIIKV
jgi:predicted kinase